MSNANQYERPIFNGGNSGISFFVHKKVGVEDSAIRRKEDEGLDPWRIIWLRQEQDRTYLSFFSMECPQKTNLYGLGDAL